MQREKRTISGRLLECDFFPIFENGAKVPTRRKKEKISSAAQQKYNELQATKKVVRLVNCNFDDSDYFMTVTYAAENAPESEEQARKNIVNYLRRIKTKRKAEAKKAAKIADAYQNALQKDSGNSALQAASAAAAEKAERLAKPMKYIYCIERRTYKTGERKGKDNWHYHLFVSGGLDAAEMERAWTAGARCNCARYQPQTFGLEAAAKYLCKDPQGRKRFACSKNLDRPITLPPKDGKVTAGTVAKMATQRIDDAVYWERRYKGYRFVRCFARMNPFNGHWYVSVVMYRTESEPPAWSGSEWLTEDF